MTASPPARSNICRQRSFDADESVASTSLASLSIDDFKDSDSDEDPLPKDAKDAVPIKKSKCSSTKRVDRVVEDRAKASDAKKVRSSRSTERSPKSKSGANILARSKSSRSLSKSKVSESTKSKLLAKAKRKDPARTPIENHGSLPKDRKEEREQSQSLKRSQLPKQRKDPACIPIENHGSFHKDRKEGSERSHSPKRSQSPKNAPPLRKSSTSSGRIEKGGSCRRLPVAQRRERSLSPKQSQSPRRAPPLRTSSTSSGRLEKGESCRRLPVVQRTSSVANRRTGMLNRREEQAQENGPKELALSDLATSRQNRLIGSRRQLSKRSVSQGEQRSSLLQRSKSDRIIRKAKSLGSDGDNAASTNQEAKHPSPTRGLTRSVSRQRRDVSSIQRAQLQRSLHLHDSWMVADLEYDPVEPAPRSRKTKQSIRALSKDPASAPLRTHSPSRADIGPRYTYSAYTA